MSHDTGLYLGGDRCDNSECQLCDRRRLVERFATRALIIDCPNCSEKTCWQEDEATPITCDSCGADLATGLEELT